MLESAGAPHADRVLLLRVKVQQALRPERPRLEAFCAAEVCLLIRCEEQFQRRVLLQRLQDRQACGQRQTIVGPKRRGFLGLQPAVRQAVVAAEADLDGVALEVVPHALVLGADNVQVPLEAEPWLAGPSAPAPAPDQEAPGLVLLRRVGAEPQGNLGEGPADGLQAPRVLRLFEVG